MTSTKQLPWVCPDHPAAQIRHEWDRTRTTVRMTGAGWDLDHKHQFFCAECGRELAPDPQIKDTLCAR